MPMQLSAQYSPEYSVKVIVPALHRAMVNPIGAGDAVSSGTLLRWCRNVPLIENQESNYQVNYCLTAESLLFLPCVLDRNSDRVINLRSAIVAHVKRNHLPR